MLEEEGGGCAVGGGVAEGGAELGKLVWFGMGSGGDPTPDSAVLCNISRACEVCGSGWQMDNGSLREPMENV